MPSTRCMQRFVAERTPSAVFIGFIGVSPFLALARVGTTSLNAN